MISLQQKGLIALQDLTKQDILDILDHAKKFKNGLRKNTLEGKVLASCFFEPSTRTRLSFESAVAYLGGKFIGFADSSSTSLNKGETFSDTLQMINCYADGLIMRHPNDGAARLASEIMHIPVINAGDGANQHPTQTLLDLFSIQDSQGQLDEINLGLMGDLKYSRTIHSLINASKFFKMRLYLTRLQTERFNSSEVITKYGINAELLANAKPNLRILHPLPRREELPIEIDQTPYAYYFQQAQNGLFVRQALLDLIFGGI
ncbi:MAG: aspartate carbamoyltransferase [Pseudomonadota bacterium]